MLAYRTNAPETPRPPKPHLLEEYRSSDGLDWRPRILHYSRPPISLTTTQLMSSLRP